MGLDCGEYLVRTFGEQFLSYAASGEAGILRRAACDDVPYSRSLLLSDPG